MFTRNDIESQDPGPLSTAAEDDTGTGDGNESRPAEHSAPLGRERSRLIPHTDKLTAFRTILGISEAPTLTATAYFRRPASNIGIYARIVNSEATSKQQYKIFSFLINGCLGLQIVVAAALTALGAADGPRALVTLFGAFN
ncbi:hypothetical protein P152DRAFT_485916 [Eremomyces bilateralis CBS 781.70]|uniref:SMODS and SLOG-associating 2TM effector domain-containing protein n=1 Tax=Eremomyces bilateralis CBS 781.70 TaxID=1392243 RepID=A0A6G1FPX3_9PEZI|nr:uncharacterized protein P152DRAFT_485916 [Eremomyces bilateralis CBS 781.70]KAF1807854.1 hypothetical protein P152DRAFT_485916 [Eremomyces bilateralis CBS 781.70]